MAVGLLSDNCVRIELKIRFCASPHVRINNKEFPNNVFED